jgi:hypothetical protein
MPENPTPDPTQLSLIQRAIQGDAQAMQNVLQYLNAASPDLRHIIQAQLHQAGDTSIWQHLLYCLGHGCWQIDETPSPNLPHSETSQRSFQTIVEVFVIDENEQEAADKMQVLRLALSDADADLRIAAYLRVLGSPATRSAAPPIAQQLLAGWSSHVPKKKERNLQKLFA